MILTDREFQQQCKRVKAIAQKWTWALALDTWKIDMRFLREEGPADDKGWNECMHVNLQWAYQEATIQVFIPAIAESSDYDVERMFLHECMHILTGELAPSNPSQAFREHFEHVATMLSLVLMRTQDMLYTRVRKEVHAELKAARPELAAS